MVIVIAGLLALVAFVVLCQLLWQPGRPVRYTTVITVAAAVLVAGLAVLAASGRLHWLIAAAAAVFPFLRRGLGLLRFAPLIGSLMRRFGWGAGAAGASSAGSTMSRERALEILDLSGDPGAEEIRAAHRRLIQRLHPDRGGSKYLAQQLNEAKQRLLSDAG